MKKIALISEHASPIAPLGGVNNGGQNVYVAHVARNLAAAGYQVDIFTRKDHANLPEVKQWLPGVRIIYVPAGPADYVPKEELFQYMDLFADFTIEFFKKQDQPYDLVHANFWMSGWVAIQIKQKLHIPFVVTFHALGRVRREHQGENDSFPDVRFEIEDRISAEADRIIAECPQDEEDLVKLYGANPERITIIPCGFDIKEINPVEKKAARKKLSLPQNERILLQLGRMVPRKGVDNVIRGLARLVHNHDIPAQLVIVGGESEEPGSPPATEIDRLKAIAAEENVADRVTFIGQKSRQELKYYYSAADIFVSTPWYEPFGITPVEAMACGTPVIGANVGGIKYTVVHNKTGLLVEPNDPDALAAAAAQLFSDPALIDQFGRHAMQRVNNHFTWRKVTRAIADLYEEVLETGVPVDIVDIEQLLVINQSFNDAIAAFEKSRTQLSGVINEAAHLLTSCLKAGNKIMVCGNGGSAADSQHFAAELVGRYKQPKRIGLPVLALNADPTFITAWANDIDYDQIFSRQVEAFGKEGDVLIVISTSGHSKNTIQAVKAAKKRGIACIALTGKDGGKLAAISDVINMIVPASDTAHIQEVQILILHLLAELVENKFVNGKKVAVGSLQNTEQSLPLEEIYE
jgi:D-inositol-3-phosphate glycosyltransferase